MPGASFIQRGLSLFKELRATNVHISGTLGVGSSIAPGGGLAMGAISRGTIAVDPSSLNGEAKGTTWAAVANAGANDLYHLTPPDTLEAALTYGGYRTVAGSVGVILQNVGTATVNGGSLNWPYTRIAMP
jgi:hypothetical protein